MKNSETAMLMAALKLAYPKYYVGQTEDESRQAAKLWNSMLEDYTYADVMPAVKAVIVTSKFPPTIADIIEKIRDFRGREMNELEAWGYISKAVRNGSWHAEEEWKRLPENLQKIVSPEMIRTWARAEADDVETVICSHFSRTFRAVQAKQKEREMLPSSVKQYITQIRGGEERMLALEKQGTN